MKSILVTVVMAFALAGCLKPSPAMVRLQSACQAGNLSACETVVDHERDRRRALVDALAVPVSPAPPVYQIPDRPIYPEPVTVAPTNTMRTTTCQPIGNMVRCTSF